VSAADPVPQVSVVTIFLNAERFLGQAIESVRNQTFRDWELVLVDDGSTDGSVEIAGRAAALDADRIRLVRHEGGARRGMSASRNLGIAAARGEMIAFLDADDVYLPGKLERQAALLDSHPEAALVYGPSLHWHSWTGRPEDAGRDAPRKLGVPPDTLVLPPTLVRLFLDHRAWTPATCSVLVRRSAIAAVGGFDEAFQGMFEDQVFFYKLLLEWPAWVEGVAGDRYRQHPGSWSEMERRSGGWYPSRRRPNPARGRFLEWLEGYLNERSIEDPGIRRAVRRELRPYRHPVLHRLTALPARALAAARRRLRRPSP
jgi:glycosyltransferase involved in cell wall biosynthesis